MDPQEFAVSVATVADSAALINIVGNELIRPAFIQGGSILRALLTKEDAPSCSATAATSAGESRLNLLEGLGDDFFDQEAVDDDVISRIIDEITPSGAAAAAAAPTVQATASAEMDGKMEIDAEWRDIQNLTGFRDVGENPSAIVEERPPAILPRASSPLPTSPSHSSHTFSTPGTKSDLENFSPEAEDHPLSPVLTGAKRKFFRAGKGRKIFKLSRGEEGESPSSSSSSTPSLPLTQLFSQPEHKILVRDYHNFISQVEGQMRLCEQREGEFRKRLTSLTSRREEAETRRTHNGDRLRRFLEQIEKLERAIGRQRIKCREDDDLVRSLLGDEAEVRAECEKHKKQLTKHRRRLAALRGCGGMSE